MKKFLSAFLAVLILTGTLTMSSFATSYSPPFDPSAQAVYLVNLDSNMIIYDKNAQAPLEPGALAQLMTMIVTLESVPNPDSSMVSMKGYIQDEMNKKFNEYTRIRLSGLYRGEELSTQKLLWAVMLQCANEAAMMLGDSVGDGSVPYFVELMNKRAAELGAANTKFTNPTGLPDPESHTTAYDMYLIARHAMTIPAFEAMLETSAINIGPTSRQPSIPLSTTNKLMLKSSDYYNPAVTALKVGDNPKSGNSSVISFAKRNGYTYMLVVMDASDLAAPSKATNQNAAFFETNRLYSWAFDTFRVKTLLEKGKNFQEVPLRLCWEKDFLRLMSADNFTALIPDEIESSSVKYELVLPEFVNAPIIKGELVGEVKLILSDNVIGRVGIVAAESAQPSRILLLLEKVSGITRTYWFKFAVVLLVISFAAYVIYTIIKNRNRRRYSGNGDKNKR